MQKWLHWAYPEQTVDIDAAVYEDVMDAGSGNYTMSSHLHLWLQARLWDSARQASMWQLLEMGFVIVWLILMFVLGIIWGFFRAPIERVYYAVIFPIFCRRRMLREQAMKLTQSTYVQAKFLMMADRMIHAYDLKHNPDYKPAFAAIQVMQAELGGKVDELHAQKAMMVFEGEHTGQVEVKTRIGQFASGDDDITEIIVNDDNVPEIIKNNRKVEWIPIEEGAANYMEGEPKRLPYMKEEASGVSGSTSAETNNAYKNRGPIRGTDRDPVRSKEDTRVTVPEDLEAKISKKGTAWDEASGKAGGLAKASTAFRSITRAGNAVVEQESKEASEAESTVGTEDALMQAMGFDAPGMVNEDDEV
jgi:hypothetical protein